MTNKKQKTIVKEFLSADEDSSTIGSKYKDMFLDKRQEFINKMMGNKKELVKRYGKNAEQVIVGKAVKDAKNYIEKMKKQDLKELVRKTLQEEPVKEDIDLGHEDNEPHMIKGELYQIGKYAMELYSILEEYDEMNQEVDFPAWWQSKITTAKNMMSGAKHYLEFEINEPKIDAMVDKLTGEEPHEGEPEVYMVGEKKAKEDYDGDGKIESSVEEYKGSKDKAIKKAKGLAEIIASKLKEERFKKGTDIGKKGPGFEKIEKSAEKKYGSEEAGKRVAGAILKKVLAKKGK